MGVLLIQFEMVLTQPVLLAVQLLAQPLLLAPLLSVMSLQLKDLMPPLAQSPHLKPQSSLPPIPPQLRKAQLVLQQTQEAELLELELPVARALILHQFNLQEIAALHQRSHLYLSHQV